MIKKIYARNFKGLNFDQEICRFTLLVGPNGSGKSARSQALTLAIMGYLPSDGQKLPSAIFQTHASGPEMIVALENQTGARFARKYRMSPDGSVSQEAGLNGKKLNQKQIERTLADLGPPRVFDLREFNLLSEQKKIELLFSLSPPSEDLGKMTRDLSMAEEKENQARAQLRGKKGSIEDLTMAKAGMNLPAGTLAEVQGEIREKEKQLAQAEEELRRTELEEAEQKAKAKADAEALKRADAVRKEPAEVRQEIRRNEACAERAAREASIKSTDYRSMGLESLRRAKEALIDAGCEACAGIITINLEMLKFQGEGFSGNE